MAGTNSTVDGMGFEESNQEVTSTEVISGTNIYASNDITAGGDISGAGALSAANASIPGNYVSTAGNITLSAGTMSAAVVGNANGELFPVVVFESGTTPLYGAVIQAGSSVLASNDAWVAFPVAYTGTPTVITQNNTALDSELLLSLGSLNAGSFHMTGTNASDKFGWMAVGV